MTTHHDWSADDACFFRFITGRRADCVFGAGSLSHFGSVERCEGRGPGLVGRAIGLGPPGGVVC